MAHGVILGQSIPDLNNNYLALDGSNAMTGTLQANAGILVGQANNSPRSNIYTSPGQRLLINSYNTLSLVNRSKDDNITRIDFTGDSTSKKISFTISNIPSLVLRPRVISAENNRITNLADGTSDTDAATVGQLNAAVANNVSFITASNDDRSGVIISPTSLYVWMDNTLDSTSKNFTKEYNIINKWYNLSGLLSHNKTQIDLTGNNGSSEKTIGWVKFSENNFEVHIDTVYCGFAYFGTFDYHSSIYKNQNIAGMKTLNPFLIGVTGT